MPTYNGERFLTEQLDSILGQQGDFELHITVRDDGSTDGTRDILRRYEKEHGITVIPGGRIGVNASIMELVNRADENAELYAFSDQDDVWYNFRLQEAVNAFRAHGKTAGKPLLWICREELADENLQTIGHLPHPKYPGDFHNAVIQNKAPGHTQVFNRALWALFKGYPPETIFVYDWVVYLLASAFGELLYCPRPCGKYRQHGANAIGYSPGGRSHFRRRLKRLFSGALGGIAGQQAHFLARYKENLTADHRSILESFVYNNKNLFLRLRFALTTRIKRDTVMESLQFRILYVLGVFR
jgi:glycosyltransferase involved in cell wall biosynthesis